jgi:dihydrofolate reductase
MRKLILQLAVSLDGYIEGPNGEYDWCFPVDEHGMTEFFGRIDALFMGRKSYELFSSAGAEAPPGFPKLKEYVFSNTLESVKEGAVLVKGDIAEEVNKIKNEEGKDIWVFGGASLTTTLMNLDLIDEMGLAIHPIVLGAGKPLFQNITERKPLTLVKSKIYPSGLAMLTYIVSKKEDIS